MRKKIKDLTLKEIRRICNRYTGCSKCPLYIKELYGTEKPHCIGVLMEDKIFYEVVEKWAKTS